MQFKINPKETYSIVKKTKKSQNKPMETTSWPLSQFNLRNTKKTKLATSKLLGSYLAPRAKLASLTQMSAKVHMRSKSK